MILLRDWIWFLRKQKTVTSHDNNIQKNAFYACQVLTKRDTNATIMQYKYYEYISREA